MTTPTPSDATSESLFAAFIERVESGDVADVEALCRQHPRHAAELRALHRRWQRLEGAWDRVGEKEPRAKESSGPTRVDLSSQVYSRIASKPPATTRYRVRDEVARGGMGVVLRVWDGELNRHLAMKVMLASDSADPRPLARFLEEAQITGQLDHPGIVPVHELALDGEGRVCFMMKLVEGRTLREVFGELGRGEGGWTQVRVLGVLLKVCEAMSYAHAKGVIHRDLKPSNVMVGRFGEVYVMDWGLAKLVGRDDDEDARLHAQVGGAAVTSDSPLLTMEGEVVGTPAYMSPEQARGDLAAMGPQSDVYAVGAMLYHLLAGHMPYLPPDARIDNRAVWRRVQEGPPRHLDEVSPSVPGELAAICERAMERDVALRYADMSALAADLSAYIEGRVVRAYETGAWAEARKWVRRNKGLASAVTTAILAVVVGSIAFAIKATEATRRADDVFRLSALQDAQDLLDLAGSDALWPAHPENVPALTSWIEDARKAVAGLPGFEAKRAELRTLARSRTPEQVEAERLGHPDYRYLRARVAESDALRAALDRRRSGECGEVPVQPLDLDEVPHDPWRMCPQAWSRVAPDRTTFGQEAQGLALMQHALEVAGDDARLRTKAEHISAWAWFALGCDEEALDASRRTLEVCPPDVRPLYERRLADLGEAIDRARSVEGMREEAERIERVEAEVARLEARVSEPTVWHFPESRREARWWHAQLTELIDKLEVLQSLLADDALVAGYGWSVPKRVAFARELEEGFGEAGRYADAWDRALPEIRAAYHGLDLAPQMGLLPIGPDPDSGWWEFAHLMTGVPADRREADGRLELTEHTGLVLVLLPGGTYAMGAQSTDPSQENYDPHAKQWEAPVHHVRLSPFFLSKYEMTRGQWLRLSGTDPSFVAEVSGSSLLLPVQSITWKQCFDWLARAGLVLPSEARWEYGARAGTDTPWFTGSERDSIWERRAANLGDLTAVELDIDQPDIACDPEKADGFAVFAPVGSFTSNAFGLHDVIGNVSEFCLDGFVSSFYALSSGLDPVASWEEAPRVFLRGGAWYNNARHARVSHRQDRLPRSPNSGVGVRPARELDL